MLRLLANLDIIQVRLCSEVVANVAKEVCASSRQLDDIGDFDAGSRHELSDFSLCHCLLEDLS